MVGATTEIFKPRTDSECVTEEFRERERRWPAITFDQAREFAHSVRTLVISALPCFVQTDFSAIPAFGMWEDRPESDEELLEALGGQWARLGDEDALSD